MLKYLDTSKPYSLYIHVPFCHKRCDYCAFYSIENAANNTVDNYYNYLIKELKELISNLDKPFYTIFIGGGNPAILGVNRLIEIITIASTYGKAEEVTIEFNPEYVNENIIPLFNYINRISVGIQSFSQKALDILGRNTNPEISKKALEFLSNYDINKNADLITCIPTIDVEQSLEDITQLHSYGVNHISLYALTFEEGTLLTEREKAIGDEKQAEYLTKLWNHLDSLNFSQYEVSNFAHPGFECKHNLVYWHLGQYFAIGSSAEGSIGYNNILSYSNSHSIENITKQTSVLNKIELQEELLLTNLRLPQGINKEEYKNRTTYDFDKKYTKAINKLDKSLYINNAKSFSLTKKGFLVLDFIVLQLAMML